MKEMDEL